MVQITLPNGRILAADERKPLSEALRRATGLEQPCGGRGTCGKCRVRLSGALTPPTDLERSCLSPRELSDGLRLACQTYPLGDIRLEESRRDEAVILTGGQLPEFVRTPGRAGLGLAVDIGTTTLAAYLFQLGDDNRLLAEASAKNPQTSFGADVISRIQLAMQGRAGDLQTAILQALDQLARKTAGSRLPELNTLVLTGNTAMLYLLTGENPLPLSAAPFTLTRAFGESHTAAALGLAAVPAAAEVYLCPAVSAYVGADIASAALSARLDAAQDNTLMIDIGTNGEMVLRAGGHLLCCSTAAGPAFEGAGIRCGSAAVTGAVSRVWTEGESLRCSVIGNGEPRSICGSGVIDALAALLELEAMDETGRLDEDVCRHLGLLADLEDETAVRIAGEVILTQKDIRAVQLAKAAICAGALTLMEHGGLTASSLQALIVAGGFGYYMDLHSAEAIGLIPEGTAAKARVVGNAAGMGACMALLSETERRETERLAREMETVSLYDDAVFREQYIECMMFELQGG